MTESVEEQKMEDRDSECVKEGQDVLGPDVLMCCSSSMVSSSTDFRDSIAGVPACSSNSYGERGGTVDCPTTAEQGVRSTRGSRRCSTLLSDRPSHKRRTLQDMTKPLKMWLYGNMSNPYPTKKEKVALASESEMTLVQVCNWFANARRRLKNTVRQPGLSWSKRSKRYNMHASDNTERLGVNSSLSDELEVEAEHSALPQALSTTQSVESCRSYDRDSRIAPPTAADEETSCPQLRPSTPIDGYPSEAVYLHKFKQCILHRYLNDSIQHQRSEYQPLTHQHQFNERTPPPMRLNESGSMSSRDYDDVSCSPNSTESDGNQPVFRDGCALYDMTDENILYNQSPIPVRPTSHGGDTTQINDAEETYWKEITAALVLTNMARAKRQQRLL